MRKKLGLKPLNVVTPEEKAARAAKEQADRENAIKAAKDEAENDDIRERLARRKKKRLLNAKVKGKSLGESLSKVTGGSAADWVNRSRTMAKEKELASKYDELDAQVEESYTEKDLKGLKITHNVDDFQEGSNVILTLKDQPILSGKFDDVELNNEEDMLMNVNLADDEKYEKLNEAKKKALKPKYDVYGDDDPTKEKSLLAHYDDEDDNQKEGMRIGGEDVDSEEEREKRAARVRERLKRKKKDITAGKVAYSLNSEKRLASDYKKPEEVKFKKRRKKKDGKKKKKRKLRTTSTMDFLPEPTKVKDHQEHHGSRAAGNTKKAKKEAARKSRSKREKDASYLRALNKEEAKKSFVMRADDDDGEEFDYEDKFDIQLQTALTRAREVGNKKRTRTKDKQDKTEMLAKHVLSVEKDNEEMVEETSGKSAGIVLSSTSEFCRGLEDTTLKEKKSELKVHDREEMQVDTQQTVAMDTDEKEEDGEMPTTEDNDADDNEEDEDVDFLHDEPLASGGVAAVIALAKRRGMLQNQKELQKNDPAPKLNLEYPDEYGRPMTQKEAFRKLSHTFHGKTPGRLKQEKKMKKYLLEIKSKKIGNIDDPSHTISKLKQRQRASGKAFLVLDQKLTADDREKLVKEAQKLAKRKRKKQKKKEKAAKKAEAAARRAQQ